MHYIDEKLITGIIHVHVLKSVNLDTARAGSLYSTVDGSRRGVFWLVGEKKIKNEKCLLANVGGRKKIKGKFSKFYLFLGIFNMFLTKKVYTCREDLCHVGGENKKKAECSVFFSCRA